MSSPPNTPSLAVAAAAAAAAVKKNDGAKARRNRRLTSQKLLDAKNLAMSEENKIGLEHAAEATVSRTGRRRSSPGVSGLPTKSIDPGVLEEEEQESVMTDEPRKVVVGAERVSGPSAVPGQSFATLQIGGSYYSTNERDTTTAGADTDPTAIVAEAVDEAAQRNQQAELEELRNQREDVEQLRKFYTQIPSAQAEAVERTNDKTGFDKMFRQFCCCFPCLQESSPSTKRLFVAGFVVLFIGLVAAIVAVALPKSPSADISSAPSAIPQPETPAPSMKMQPTPAPVDPVTLPPQSIAVPNPLDVSLREFENGTVYEIVYSHFLYDQYGWVLTVPKGVTVPHTPSSDLRDDSTRYVFIEDNPSRAMAKWHLNYGVGRNAWQITCADEQSQYFGWHLMATQQIETDRRDHNSNYLFISRRALEDVPYPWQIQVLATDGDDDASNNSSSYRLWAWKGGRGLITDRAHQRDLRSDNSTYASVHENTSYRWFIRPLE